MNRFTLCTLDGVRLDAVHLPHDSRACVIVVHGFTRSWRRRSLRRALRLFNLSSAVIGFDLRGHGRSSGRSTVGAREVLDVHAAVQYARTAGYRQVTVVGFSLGGAIALRYAALFGEVESLVAVSAPVWWYDRSTKPMRRAHFAIERPAGRLAVHLFCRTRMLPRAWGTAVPAEPLQLAAHIAPIPLLIVHGDADHFLSPQHARALYTAARDPRELWLEPSFGHADAAATPDLLQRIATWINEKSLSPKQDSHIPPPNCGARIAP